MARKAYFCGSIIRYPGVWYIQFFKNSTGKAVSPKSSPLCESTGWFTFDQNVIPQRKKKCHNFFSFFLGGGGFKEKNIFLQITNTKQKRGLLFTNTMYGYLQILVLFIKSFLSFLMFKISRYSFSFIRRSSYFAYILKSFP